MPKGKYKRTVEHKNKISQIMTGRKLSEEHKNNISNSLKGRVPKSAFKKGHQTTKGMKYKTRNTNKGRSNATARKILEERLGRSLRNNEVVHHVDEDSTNNNVENLEAMDWLKHQQYHKNKQIFINQKLSKEDVEYIVKHTEINYKELASKFDICPTYVYEVRRRYNGGKSKWIF